METSYSISKKGGAQEIEAGKMELKAKRRESMGVHEMHTIHLIFALIAKS